MASAGDPYLPDLAKCFAGDALVFSWEQTLQIIQKPSLSFAPEHQAALLSSQKAKSLLSQNVPTFDPPSSQSRSGFETKTAAINVTPSSNSTYDIAQVKSDTEWLSKEVNLSEEESLRVVLLEWQRRPEQQLLAGYSEAELASLKDSIGRQDAGLREGLGQIFRKRLDDGFGSETERKRRLLITYFRESGSLLSVKKEVQQVTLLSDPRAIETASDYKQFAQDVNQNDGTDRGVQRIVTAIDTRLQSLSQGKSWSVETDLLEEIWTATELQSARILIEILLLQVRALKQHVSKDVLLQWLQIMAGSEFFAGVQPSQLLSPTELERLQTISSIVTVALINPASVVASLSDPQVPADTQQYFLDVDAVTDIHNIMFSAAESSIPQAGPSVLAWALILDEIRAAAAYSKEMQETHQLQRTLDQTPVSDSVSHRRPSLGSINQSAYEDIMDRIISISPTSEPVAYLLRCAVEADRAFDVIVFEAQLLGEQSSLLDVFKQEVLQELVSVALANTGYSPDILSCQFAILSRQPSTQSEINVPSLRDSFVRNDFLMDSMFAVAAARFPYESLPYLRLCKHLASAKIFDEEGTQYVTYRLKSMESFTQVADGSFASYHTIREDENLNLVALGTYASMLEGPRLKSIGLGRELPNMNTVPSDTTGEVISESSPPIIRWHHSFSGLSLFGAWLELHYLGQLKTIISDFESAEDVIAEVIGLLTALLANTLGEVQGVVSDGARKHLQDAILDETSASLKQGSDASGYVFEILEQELQAFRQRPSNTFNTNLLVACIDFLTIFLQIRPDQFWILIAKSSLLESHGTDSFIGSIVGAVEIPAQRFPFLESCSLFYQRVIAAALQVSHGENIQTAVTGKNYFQSQTTRLYTNILLSLTQSLYDAYDTLPGWTFISLQQKWRITNNLNASFENVLFYTYGAGEIVSPVTACFSTSAEFLAQQMRTSTEDVTETTSILRHLFVFAYDSGMSMDNIRIEDASSPIRSLLSLAHTLTRLGKTQGLEPSSLELQFFDAIPLLARLLVFDQDCLDLCLDMIHDLLAYIGQVKPVSLLGYLGSQTTINLLNILKIFGNNYRSTPIVVSTWKLLASLVGRDQQWLAIVILTGSPPEKTKRESTSEGNSVIRGSTFIDIALKKLVKVSNMNLPLSVAMLEFLVQAQQNWSWANDALSGDKDFLPSVISYVCNTFIDASDQYKISYRNKIASLVTSLSTTHLHFAKAVKNSSIFKTILPLLDWLTTGAIDVNSYNASLHANLKKNFARKFTGLEIVDFKRTGLVPGPYGDEYFYDLGFIGEVLKFEPHWDRKGKYQNQSFSAELRRANLNLSVVDSELLLLRSFQSLCVEHGGFFAHNEESQTVLARAVRKCLTANTQIYPPEQMFESLFQSRAELSIALLQRLIDSKAKGAELKPLLRAAWECAIFRNSSYEQAVTSNDLVYWRSVLTVVLMALYFHVDKRYQPPAIDPSPAALLRHTENSISIILEIVSTVVGHGLRTVTTALQDQNQAGNSSAEASPESTVMSKDVYLIMTIFETILRMARLPEFTTGVSDRLIAAGVIQSCLVLYSWSHTLISPEFNNEPIYADYCLHFLATLSSLPPVAEELAVQGVWSRILSARVTQRLQKFPDGAGHLDKRPHSQPLYDLWASGILPICLNLLYSVGAPVAAEISVFLNQFPNQLVRASEAFVPVAQSRTTASDTLTLTLANEAATLALISFILESYRKAGASAAVDPATIATLAGYDEHKRALADDISDIVNSSITNLKPRIAAMSEKEMTYACMNNGDGLAVRIKEELNNALVCLRSDSIDEDEK